jgi:hypothetical protein
MSITAVIDGTGAETVSCGVVGAGDGEADGAGVATDADAGVGPGPTVPEVGVPLSGAAGSDKTVLGTEAFTAAGPAVEAALVPIPAVLTAPGIGSCAVGVSSDCCCCKGVRCTRGAERDRGKVSALMV